MLFSVISKSYKCRQSLIFVDNDLDGDRVFGDKAFH